MKKLVKKKGISPVIATMLLIGIVVATALIVFLWFKSVVGDYGQKFGKNVELVCEEVQLNTDYSGGFLYVTNDGNVPVFRLNLKISGGGNYETKELNSIVEGTSYPWPESGLSQGGVYSGDISAEASSAEKIIVIPVLMGVSDKGIKKTYACNEQYGYEIII